MGRVIFVVGSKGKIRVRAVPRKVYEHACES